MRVALLALLIATIANCKDEVIKAKYNYSLSLYYESNLTTCSIRSIAFVNGKHLTCFCGGHPILIMIVYGHVQAFCYDHIPPIDINSGHDCRCKEKR